MYYPEELVEEIRLHNDIVEVISSYVSLKRKGNTFLGLCPFHNEKTPSFSVSQDKQLYHCFGCGAGGNVYTFIMEYENFSFVEAIKFLADRVHIELPTQEMSKEQKKQIDIKQQLIEINKVAARYFYYQLKTKKGEKAKEYLIQRGISEDVLKRFGLGYSHIYSDDLLNYLRKTGYDDSIIFDAGLISKGNNNDYYDRFWNRVMFPILDVHNRVIGFGGRVLGEGNPKYLNSPETILFDKSKNLYGLNIARTTRKGYFLMVEGYMDVISLHQVGFNETVASLGTALTVGHAKLLKRYTDKVIIAYDSDNAGINATIRAIPILKEASITVKVLNVKPYKDPDEFIKAKGADEFSQRIIEAQNSLLFEIEILQQKYDLSDPEQKTNFLKAVAIKILEFESEIERDNYIEAIANKYLINKSSFKKLIDSIGSRVGLISYNTINNNENKKERKTDGIVETQKILLSYMVQYNEIFIRVKQFIEPDDFKEPVYQKVSNIIYNKFNEEQKIEPASIINQFSSLEEQKQVATLFNEKILISNNVDLERLINETVYKIKKYSLDYASRNAKDIETLQNIIIQQSNLQKLHISLNDG